jgi:hypothetical protein
VDATVGARFWSKVEILGSDECWLWRGYVNNYGYGDFWIGRNTKAHRYSYELQVGPIPAGLVLDHLCRVRHCVNPRHLEPVTIGENVMRGKTLAAANAAKTSCMNGHPFTPENTWRRIDRPGRVCRICRGLSVARCRAKRAVA